MIVEMSWDNITSIMVAVMTIIGSPIISMVLDGKRQDRKIVAYKNLFESLSRVSHYPLEVSEYFRMASGLKFKYSDIKTIINDEDSIWLIEFLRKMPGYVVYENGVFKYSERFNGKRYLSWIQKMTKFMNTFGKYLSAFGYLVFSGFFIYFMISGISIGLSIFFIVMISLSAFGFVMLNNMQAKDKKLDELIQKHANANIKVNMNNPLVIS